MSDSRTIYLDHAATSWPKAPGAADAMSRYLREAAGNPFFVTHLATKEAAFEAFGLGLVVAEKNKTIVHGGKYTDFLAHLTIIGISFRLRGK